MPRRVLITGGAGFIGSHLTEALLAQGERVTIVDNLSTGSRRNLSAVDPAGDIEFIDSSLRDALPDLSERDPFDEIYHLAAAVGVALVMDDPIGAIETNVEQTAALLRFARPRDGAERGTPVLLASSSEVYGKGTHDVFSEDDDVLYGPTTITRWSYAQTKAIDEYLLLAHQRDHRVPGVVVRFFNTVGPRQVGDYGMVLPRFVAAALKNEPITVHGDGSQSRCFCDVRDSARALPTLLRTPACEGRVFNLGSDKPISIIELAETVVRVTGSKSEIRMVPYSDAYPEGFEDLKRRRPSLSRVREAIGFEPKITIEQTVADIAETIRGEQPTPIGG